MRTTLSIDDHLLAEAKERARERRQTLGQLVEDSLRRELGAATSRQGAPIPVRRGGTGAHPGLDMTSNRAMWEFLDEGRPLDKLR